MATFWVSPMMKKLLEQQLFFGTSAKVEWLEDELLPKTTASNHTNHVHIGGGGAWSLSAASSTNYTQVFPLYAEEAFAPKVTLEEAIAANNAK
jgi:hypothetical protein